MHKTNQDTRMLSAYTSPECTVVILDKADIVTASSIYLPMHPLFDDSSEYYYNNPGLLID